MDNLFVGNSTIHLSEVDSTNSYANALLKDVKPPEGTIIWADRQTAGRGMRGNTWSAEPLANITCSVILHPNFLNAGNHFFLSKAIALALFATLTELPSFDNYDIKIKWPNDILVNGKKIAGVLIENSFRDDRIQHSIVGIGLNVNQQNFGVLADKATSLALLAGKHFDREEILKRLAKHIEVQYLRLKQNKVEVLNINYHKNLLFFNEETTFVDLKKNESFSGTITNVANGGKLEVRDATNTLRYFDMKEISFSYESRV